MPEGDKCRQVNKEEAWWGWGRGITITFRVCLLNRVFLGPSSLHVPSPVKQPHPW